LTPELTAELAADMSAAPEIAMLAEAARLVPAQPASGPRNPADPADLADLADPAEAAAQLTLGMLAQRLRCLASTPERWWNLVRFDPDRSVKIVVEESAAHQAWLVIMPPGDAGHSCECAVAAMIAGEATEGAPGSTVLRPGSLRVHGQPHGLRGRGTGYSISLHARAQRPPG
jgi:hypothetical protein